MYCVHCGQSIADGSRFCPLCGRPQAANPDRPAHRRQVDLPLDGERPPRVPQAQPAPAPETGPVIKTKFKAKAKAGARPKAERPKAEPAPRPKAPQPSAGQETAAPRRFPLLPVLAGALAVLALVIVGVLVTLMAGSDDESPATLASTETLPPETETAAQTPQTEPQVTEPPEELTIRGLPEAYAGFSQALVGPGGAPAGEEYLLWDLDGQEPMELILHSRDQEGNEVFTVYAFKDGQVQALDSQMAGNKLRFGLDGSRPVLWRNLSGTYQVWDVALAEGRVQWTQRPDQGIRDYLAPETFAADNPAGLRNIYTDEAAETIWETRGYVPRPGALPCFLRGEEAVWQLDSGAVLALDTGTGEISQLCALGREERLLAVTRDRLYAAPLSGSRSKGVFSCSRSGEDRRPLQGDWEPENLQGWLLLKAWRPNRQPDTCLVVDPADGETAVTQPCWDVAVAEGSAWLLLDEGQGITVARLSPDGNLRRLGTIPEHQSYRIRPETGVIEASQNGKIDRYDLYTQQPAAG